MAHNLLATTASFCVVLVVNYSKATGNRWGCLGSGGGRLLHGWLGKGTGMEVECKLKVLECGVWCIDIVQSVTVKLWRGAEEEEEGRVNAVCVDFFPFTKLKDCKSHVCFLFLLFVFLYSSYSSLPPNTPCHTENPPPEHTDTHHSHLINLEPLILLSYLLLHGMSVSCSCVIGPFDIYLYIFYVFLSDFADTPLWLPLIRKVYTGSTFNPLFINFFFFFSF